MQYDNTNKIKLFKNKNKQEGDTKPVYTGTLNVEGRDFFVDAWVNVSKAGEKYLSGKIKLKTKQPTEEPEQELDDEVPF